MNIFRILNILYVSYFLLNTVHGFPPKQVAGESDTKSHYLINIYGFYTSAYNFLVQHNLVNGTGLSMTDTINQFFGTDADSQTHFLKNIFLITDHQSDVQRQLAGTAHYHVNGEQIIIAHNYVRSLRKTLISLTKSLLPESNIDIIREKMAHCLYTIQQFYSNTNWVEIHGETVLKEFGIAESLQVKLSDLSESTCKDCPTDTNSVSNGLCKNNILSDRKLTSGYKSGQDVAKPQIGASGKGKCSHGSRDDDSKQSTATGGIYKGRSSSAHAPHYHLHLQAFEAAKQASIYFLTDEDNGLMNVLGFDLFKEALSIKTRQEDTAIKSRSITFVIDVTGSMADNIASVRKATTKYVELIRTSENVPEKYILVTFSDPVTLESARETSSADEMINWLTKLGAIGGGDCPEYALSGLITGATKSNENSTVYIITDAPAKDENKETEVITVLQRKHLTPKFLITPECSARKKRHAGRHKRSSSVYDRIAQATGGTVNRVQTSELQAVVEADLTKDIPTSVAVIKWTTMQSSDPDIVNIEVDDSIFHLSIFISGLKETTDLILRYPNGTAVRFDFSEEINLDHNGTAGAILIKSPEKGRWTLERLSNDLWIVNVTSSSTFDFTPMLNEQLNGILFPVKGNPVSGENYTLIADLENLPANYNVSSFVLVDEAGKAILEVTPILLSKPPALQYSADFNLDFTNKVTGVQLHGKDSEAADNLFVRSSPLEINPVDITLSMLPYTGELSLFREEQLFYTITNHGSTSKSLSVTVSDDKNYIVGGNSSVVFLVPAGKSVTRNFEIRGTEALSIVTVEITVIEFGERLQNLRQRFVVSSATRPSCNITSLENTCRDKSFTAKNCSEVRWRGNAVVEYAGTNLTSLHVSSANVHLTHGGLSDISGPVDAELVGDCCASSVVLSAVDIDGFFSQCRFLLYPENWVATNIIKDTSEPLKSVETSFNFGILVGIVGALVGIGILVAVVKFCHSSDVKTYPMEDKTDPYISTEFQTVYFHNTPPADSRYIDPMTSRDVHLSLDKWKNFSKT